MKNRNLYIAIGALGLSAIVLYIYIKKRNEETSDYQQTEDDTNIIISNGDFQNYRVATESSSLNVRDTPNMSGRVVATLSKNQIIFARPSSTSGWYEYSSDGRNVSGYVSKLYLSSETTSGAGGGTGTSSSWGKYMVNTSSSSLNVRQSPSLSSAVTSSLSKGATIFARPSGTSGWYEYSSNGSSVSGYVSESYLSKI